MISRWLRRAWFATCGLLGLATFYVVGAQFLGMTAIRSATWMALVPFAANFAIFPFAGFVGFAIAKSNHPEKYARKVDRRSIPMRYRIVLFNVVLDRRDVELDRYLPNSKVYLVAFAAWAAIGLLSYVTSSVAEAGVPKYLQRFSEYAPAFAATAAAFLTLALMFFKAGRVWLGEAREKG